MTNVPVMLRGPSCLDGVGGRRQLFCQVIHMLSVELPSPTSSEINNKESLCDRRQRQLPVPSAANSNDNISNNEKKT